MSRIHTHDIDIHTGESSPLAYSTQLQKVLDAITHIEGKSRFSVGSYVKYTEAFQKLPMYCLTVCNSKIEFLVDSGATHSVLKTSEISPFPKLSGRYIHSMGASGKIVKENFTCPLSCSTKNSTMKHSFLLSPNCPVNLLGRDLMIKLNLSLISTPEGLKIQGPCFPETDMQMAKIIPQPFLYVYQWHILWSPEVEKFEFANR